MHLVLVLTGSGVESVLAEEIIPVRAPLARLNVRFRARVNTVPSVGKSLKWCTKE